MASNLATSAGSIVVAVALMSFAASVLPFDTGRIHGYIGQ
jgi:hypothetical protein